MEIFLFIVFSSFLLLSGLGVVIVINPVSAVFYLVLSFFNAACLLLLIEVEFLAILFIIVYVGAIAVLFLFVVIMLNLKLNVDKSSGMLRKYLPFGLFVGITFSFIIFYSLYIDFNFFSLPFSETYTNWILSLDSIQNIEVLGNLLYTYYFLYFLVAGLILLVAIVSAIILTIRHDQFFLIKKQFVSNQLARHHKNAVFLIKRV